MNLELLRRGAQVPAGIGMSTVVPDCDFETYSEAGYVWDSDAGRWRAPEGAPKGEVGLGVVGVVNYTDDPTFEVLTFSYDLKDGLGRRRWVPLLPPPIDLFDYIKTGGPLEAWNVGFERWVWENHCVPKLGWPPVAPHQWRCAMAKARAHALPGRLAKAGDVLDLTVKKDADGDRLLRKFSMPRNPTQGDPRLRIRPIWRPEDAANLAAAEVQRLVDGAIASGKPLTQRQIETRMRHADEKFREEHHDSLRLLGYNETDIASEAEASSRIPDLTPAELRFWQDDQAINKRGVQVDLDSIEACIKIIHTATRRYGDELLEITGGIKPTEVAKLLGWLHGLGVHLDSLDEDSIDHALRKLAMPPQARRALEIRQALASASVKKVFAMRNQASRHGRLHDLYQFHGARTGRPTGSGPQPTNLPKAGPHVFQCGHDATGKPLESGGCGRYHGAHTMTCHWCGKFTLRGPKDGREWNPEAMEDALRAISYRSLDFMEILFGDALLTIAGCLRGLFIAKPGHDFVSSDFTAIEGVVVACIAGEQWRIDAYANDEPMYLLSAERMFGVPVAEMKAYAKANGHHHPLRQKGKGGELGLGFGGWITALRQFDVDGTDDELKDTVLKWRKASPHIEWLWGGQKRGPADVIRENAGLHVQGGADRWNKTPEYFGLEGAAINAVANPGRQFDVCRIDGSWTGVSYLMHDDVLYCRVPSGGLITYHRPRLEKAAEDWRGLALSFEGWNTNPKSGPVGWIRMGTYSGKLTENVVQKTARDIQMGAIARLEDRGYSVVMHTYDEIVAEVPEGFGSVEELEALMTTQETEPWRAGWPIKAAGGWRGGRYRKG